MPEPSFHDEALWGRAARGDREALEALIALALPRLRKFLFRLSGFDPDPVDDQAQEVFMRLLDGISRLRRPGAGPAWLFRTALHVHREERRRRRAAPGGDPAEDAPAESRANPAVRAADRELQQQVSAAVAGLPESLREVLVLSVYERLAPREIARVLDLSGEAVRHRLHRARQALHAVLRPGEEVRP